MVLFPVLYGKFPRKGWEWSLKSLGEHVQEQTLFSNSNYLHQRGIDHHPTCWGTGISTVQYVHATSSEIVQKL